MTSLLNPFTPTAPAAVTAPATPVPDPVPTATHTVRVTVDVEVWVGTPRIDVGRAVVTAMEEFVGHVDGGLDSVRVEKR
jgi:hypothetical protein